MNTVKKSKKNLKFTSIAGMLAAMLTVVVILINVAVSFFNIQLDMTPNKLYSLNDKTVNYLNALEEDVDIYLLMKLDDIKNASDADEMMAFTNMMEQLDEFDKVNIVDIDPNEDPEIITELNPDGLLNLQSGDMVVKCGKNIRRVPASEMYIYEYDTDADGNQVAQNAYFQGENLITGAIKSVVEGISPSIYFLTGHGEKDIDTYYTNFKKNLKNVNYKVETLNLATEEAVPEDAAIIIVAAPKNDITADEKDKLNKFMDNGGNLSLLMSPNQTNEEYENLVSIMNDYCIGMDYNKITETDTSRHLSGDENTIMVELVDVQENSKDNQTGTAEDLISGNLKLDTEKITDLTSTLIEEMSAYVPYMPSSRSFFDYNGENYSTLNICPLIQTYATAESTKFGGNEALDFVMNAPFYLSAYSEDPTRNNSKLVVMGNAEFIDDEHLSEAVTIVPLYLYLETISWMADSNIDMDIPVREKTYDYMVLETKDDTNMVLIIIVAAPIIVALSGVIIWFKRRHS